MNTFINIEHLLIWKIISQYYPNIHKSQW